MNAHLLPRARWPSATPLNWRRGATTLLAGCSALILATLAVAAPVGPATATAGTESTKSHKSAAAAKPRTRTERTKPHSKTGITKLHKGDGTKSRTKAEATEAAKPRTTEAVKHRARHPSVGHAANPAPALPVEPILGDAKSAAKISAFEHGPGVLGMSLRTLRQEQIKEYVSEPVAMVALAFDDLRFAPVNKGTHIEVNLGNRIPFDGRGDRVSPKARRPLDVIARILNDNPQTSIRVLVHTDDTGERAYNLNQSQRAAEAVKAYLITKGVTADRITALGRGAEAPLAPIGKRSPTWQERNRNRRVELVVAPLAPVPTTPTEQPAAETGAPSGAALQTRAADFVR